MYVFAEHLARAYISSQRYAVCCLSCLVDWSRGVTRWRVKQAGKVTIYDDKDAALRALVALGRVRLPVSTCIHMPDGF